MSFWSTAAWSTIWVQPKWCACSTSAVGQSNSLLKEAVDYNLLISFAFLTPKPFFLMGTVQRSWEKEKGDS